MKTLATVKQSLKVREKVSGRLYNYSLSASSVKLSLICDMQWASTELAWTYRII